jgi:uncharacterized membrane protein
VPVHRMKVPAVSFGFLAFMAAVMAGVLAIAFGYGRMTGVAWVVIVFVGVLLAILLVAALRQTHTGRAKEP